MTADIDALEAAARRIMIRARELTSSIKRDPWATSASTVRELAIVMAMLEARAPTPTNDAERIAAMLESLAFVERVRDCSAREAIAIAVMAIRSGEW